MSHPRYTDEEIDRLGTEIYARQLRARVETEGNIGKILSIDVETGDYEIGDDVIETAQRLLKRHPGAPLYGLRIGYNAVFAVGGTLERIAS